MTRRSPVIAIDGPAGAGKSTVARAVARALGFTLVDTGSLYRAVALLAHERGVAQTEREALEALATDAVATGTLRLTSVGEDGDDKITRVLLHGEDPGDKLRSPEMSMGASTVSAVPGVRAALLDAQRAFGRDGAVVLEGRDIGTVVFPDAEMKVFLTASPEERARRRTEELTARGVTVDYAETLADVRRRDAQDSGRAIAPLRPADDARILDCSAMDADAVVNTIVGWVRALPANDSRRPT